MIPNATPYNECYSNPCQFQALDALGDQSTERQAGLTFAVVHRREVVVLEFASFSKGGKSRLFCLDVLVPVHRVQRADERTRTADLLIRSDQSGVAGVCAGLQFPYI
jgi:hypothetical protein